MSLLRPFLSATAWVLRQQRGGGYRPRRDPADPRILVIRRNRMGDMICTLPLLHALRRHYPQAHLTVACDAPGVPIAQACPAVDEIILLESGGNRWGGVIRDAERLQHFDWVIAAKGGFDRRLAVLARLTGAAVRVGFARRVRRRSSYYTDPVAMPENPHEEHQIETLLRLLKPLGLVTSVGLTVELTLKLPASAHDFAAKALAGPPFAGAPRYALINLSSTTHLKFREADFVTLIGRLLETGKFAIGLVSTPADQEKARRLAAKLGSDRVAAVATPGPLELAALLRKAAFLLTPEGGAAHLAAAMKTPALVLWSEGPFKKWRSRGPNHAFVPAERGEEFIPLERVWQALQPYLAPSTR